MNLKTELSRGQLAFLPCFFRAAIFRLPHDCDARELRNGFLEQLQSFAGQLRCDSSKSRQVSTGPRQAVDQPRCNGLRTTEKNDWDRSRNVLGHQTNRCGRREDHINRKARQFARMLTLPIAIALCKSVLNGEVLSFYVAEPA